MSVRLGPWPVLCVLLCVTNVPPIWTAAAVADEPPESDPVVQAEEVVVSATKTPLPVSQVTSAVEVITAQDMKRQNIRSVVDALRLAQGVAMFSNGGPGTEVTAKIRGGGANQTLVLIDGAIVNSGTVGSYNFANLTTDNIERVEILRGAQSMLWGSDAMGGVINIVTKKGQGPLSATGFMEYGSFASIREGAPSQGNRGSSIIVSPCPDGTCLPFPPSTTGGGDGAGFVSQLAGLGPNRHRSPA
ncbi:MAG: TonB-dependent receptor plug domain-containing protein [Nitrospira sp.]|nr:TonB-dependent receptor plug domain-containing protein [Nitrospira sp.]